MESNRPPGDKGGLTERYSRQYRRGVDEQLLVQNPPVPRNLMVELSNACNHACIFCTNPNMTRRIGRMDGALLDRVMVEAYGLGVQEIGFYTTGEPFVHKDLEKFISRAAGIGYSYIYISTNGAMAEPERAKRAIDAGLTSIKFSINAGSRETYRLVHGYDDWDKVMANLRFVSRYRKTLDRPVKLFVTYIVTRHTEHEIAAFRENVGPLVDEILFCPVHNQSGQMNETQEMLTADSQAKSFKSDNICRMPFNRLHVTCEGYLTLCCVDYQNYLAIADLKETSLMDAWNSPTFQAMRVRHLQGDLKGTLCGNCWYGHKDKVEPLVPALATETDFPTFYRSAAERVARRIWESSEQRDARRGDEDDA